MKTKKVDSVNMTKEIKDVIKAKLEQFKTFRSKPYNEIFLELSYCLLTPGSVARRADIAIKNLKEKGFPNEFDIQRCRNILEESGVRFHKKKSDYLSKARQRFLRDNFKLPIGAPIELREWLVKNVEGLGYKEASHFLRNIGKSEDLAILDRHILKNLQDLKVINDIPKSLTTKKYLEIEKRMREFALENRLSLAELDLFLWSKETGYVFR